MFQHNHNRPSNFIQSYKCSSNKQESNFYEDRIKHLPNPQSCISDQQKNKTKLEQLHLICDKMKQKEVLLLEKENIVRNLIQEQNFLRKQLSQLKIQAQMKGYSENYIRYSLNFNDNNKRINQLHEQIIQVKNVHKHDINQKQSMITQSIKKASKLKMQINHNINNNKNSNRVSSPSSLNLNQIKILNQKKKQLETAVQNSCKYTKTCNQTILNKQLELTEEQAKIRISIKGLKNKLTKLQEQLKTIVNFYFKSKNQILESIQLKKEKLQIKQHFQNSTDEKQKELALSELNNILNKQKDSYIIQLQQIQRLRQNQCQRIVRIKEYKKPEQIGFKLLNSEINKLLLQRKQLQNEVSKLYQKIRTQQIKSKKLSQKMNSIQSSGQSLVQKQFCFKEYLQKLNLQYEVQRRKQEQIYQLRKQILLVQREKLNNKGSNNYFDDNIQNKQPHSVISEQSKTNGNKLQSIYENTKGKHEIIQRNKQIDRISFKSGLLLVMMLIIFAWRCYS